MLSECTTYAPVVEEIGQMWAPNHVGDLVNSAGEGRERSGGSGSGGGSGGAGGEDLAVDPALSLLIGRFATMVVQKVRACPFLCTRSGGDVLCLVRFCRLGWLLLLLYLLLASVFLVVREAA